MTVASVGADTQTAVVDTEHTLDTETDPGVYILVVDLNELTYGDTVILRIKTKNQTGSTSRLAYEATFSNAQAEMNKYSPAIPVDTEIICTLEQTDGTGRDFDWNLLKM